MRIKENMIPAYKSYISKHEKKDFCVSDIQYIKDISSNDIYDLITNALMYGYACGMKATNRKVKR